jgi:hypothetical protein
MNKVSIELEYKDLSQTVVILALARLLKYGEIKAANDDIDIFDDDEFWGESLPAALREIMGTLQFLLTAYNWDDKFLRSIFGYSDEWDSAIGFLTSETNTLREMANQVGNPWASPAEETDGA